MEKRFARDLRELDDIATFISDFAVQNDLDSDTLYAINLAVEELFVNMVKYNSGGANAIYLGLSREGDEVTVSLVDYDVDPFDITQVEEFDTTQTLDERKPGGLGIHLTRSVMDSVSYEYENRQSRIILTKRVRAERV
jgi:serine/threonine-protein kinase RsbW